MNTFCHPTIAARIETAAAAIILFLTTLTSCGRSSLPSHLTNGMTGHLHFTRQTRSLQKAGSSSTTKNTKNFRLTGEALTQPGSEAGLLFHTDGESRL